MLGAAEADALGAEGSRLAGVRGRVGVGAHLHPPDRVGPSHQGGEIAGHLGLNHRHGALHDLAGSAVDGEDVAPLQRDAARGHRLARIVDADRAGARDAGLAHAARDHRRMRRHAAARRHEAFGGVHAVNVLGARLDAHQDRLAPRLTRRRGVVGGEHDLAARGAGRGGEARRQGRVLRLGIEGRMQHLLERGRLDPRDRVLARDQPFVGHLDRHPERRARGALAVAGLQHPELAAFDGELEILHVAVVSLQHFGRLGELLEHSRHQRFERGLAGARGSSRGLGDVLRRADAGHHVFALGVDEELAVKRVLAGRGIAREGDAGRRRLAHVAEHHRLNVDRCAPIGGNVVELAVGDRALVHPRGEDCADGAPELILGIMREWLAGRLLNLGLVLDDDLAPIIGVEVGVERVALAVLVVFENVLEIVAVDVEHDIGIHLNEAAVAVVGEALVARAFRQGLDRTVVEPEVEDRVHHAGHRGARAGPHREEERICIVAEDAARLAAHFRDGRIDLGLEVGRIGLPVGVEIGAHFRGDREARRHRQAEKRHLVQIGALPAQKVLHLPPTFRALGAEGINPFCHCSLLTSRRRPEASAPRLQSHPKTDPSNPVKQKVDAQQSPQHIDAVHRPVTDNDQTQQDRDDSGQKNQGARFVGRK